MKKRYSLLVLSLLLASTLGVFATEGEDENMDDTTGEQQSSMDDTHEKREPVSKFDVSGKKRRGGEMGEHGNMVPPMMSGLTEEQKTQIEALKKEFMTSMEELKNSLQSAQTQDERVAIMEKIKALIESHRANMEKIAPGILDFQKKAEEMMREKMGNMPKPFSGSGGMMNDEMKKKFEEMMKEKMKNMPKPFSGSGGMMNDEMRKKMEQMMKEKMGNMPNGLSMEGGGFKGGERGKFKEMFAKKLAGKIENLSVEKLQTILTKLEALSQKIKDNTGISEEKRSKLLAQVGALKELVNEAIDQKSADAELNLDELFQ